MSYELRPEDIAALGGRESIARMEQLGRGDQKASGSETREQYAERHREQNLDPAARARRSHQAVLSLNLPNSHEHKAVQHRDGKEPWCNTCALNKDFTRPKSRFEIVSGNKPVLVGFGGWPRAGKDAVARILHENHGYGTTFTSEVLAKALLALNPRILLDVSMETMEGWTLERGEIHSYAYIHHQVGYEGAKEQQEVRNWLVKLGHNVGVELLGKDTWVRPLKKKILELRANGPVAVTGIRYHHDLDLIHELGGVAVWVARPGINSRGLASDDILKPEDFDWRLNNNGDLEQLKGITAYLAEHLDHHVHINQTVRRPLRTFDADGIRPEQP